MHGVPLKNSTYLVTLIRVAVCHTRRVYTLGNSPTRFGGVSAIQYSGGGGEAWEHQHRRVLSLLQ